MSIYEAVKESIAFIENNLENNIGVLDVANSVSYSQFYFSREFSNLTYISIYDYILRRKISESYKYLLETNCKIIDIAYKYSFKSHEVYTRAFKKIFRTNPSEINADKPLALFERIDERYLAFLNCLRIEIINKDVSSCYFEGVPTEQLINDKDLLILLSNDNFFNKKYILKGNIKSREDSFLFYELKGLKHKIRIHSNDIKSVFRFFLEHYYDINEIGSNYILIRNEKEFIDIITPSK